MFCAIMRQIFRDFWKVRQHGAAAIQQVSVDQRVGTTWWHVFQTDRKMAEFLHIGFKQHPTITPVFTAHLNRNRVSKTSFATLETSVCKVNSDMAAMQTSVNRLNGARGNSTPRALASTSGSAPPWSAHKALVRNFPRSSRSKPQAYGIKRLFPITSELVTSKQPRVQVEAIQVGLDEHSRDGDMFGTFEVDNLHQPFIRVGIVSRQRWSTWEFLAVSRGWTVVWVAEESTTELTSLDYRLIL
jgi:hypothetical protein